MIEVKLTFADQAALLAFFAGTKPLVSADERAAVASITADKPVAAGKPAATPAAPATKPAKTETVVGSPSEGKPDAATPAAAQQSAASTAASSASSAGDKIDYATLQKAVMALATKNKPRAKEVVESFGVATFKLLDESRWGEALAAVNAALAE